MKAQMRNGKILTGKIAEIFIRIGVAELVKDEPQADEPKQELTPKIKRSVPKRGGRPKKKKK
jgi:hypothetical protein